MESGNNKKGKLNISKVLVFMLFFVAVVSVTASLLLPGFVLRTNAKLQNNESRIVEGKYYSSENTLLARSNTNKLDLNEKLMMMSGQIERTVDAANDGDKHMPEENMLDLAWEKLVEMEKNHLYPTMTSDNKEDYSFTAECWKAIDNAFGKYTIFFWTIEIESLVSKEKHLVYTFEDGTIFVACMSIRGDKEINLDDVYRINKVIDHTAILDLRNYEEIIKEKNNQEINIQNDDYIEENTNQETIKNDDEDNLIKEIIKYPDLDVGGLQITAFYQYSNGIDQYRLLQAKNAKKYMYAILPVEY